MVLLIAAAKPLQNLDGFRLRRLIYHNRLKPAFQGRIFFDVFAVFFQRRRTNELNLAPRQRRFQDIGGIDRALRAACRARGFEPTVAYEVESTGLVYRLLEQGAGAALMPVSQMLRLRTLHPDTAIRVLPLGEGLPPASLGVSYHKGYALTDAANAFIDFASAWLAQEEAKLACTPGITTTA